MMRHNTNFSNTIDLEKNCSLKRQSEILKKKKQTTKHLEIYILRIK